MAMGSSLLLLLLLLLLFHVHSLLLLATGTPASLFLPLKTQLLSPPVTFPAKNATANMLYFQHNVTLLVSLRVGSPPQNVSMVLDTGSELSWLLCSDPPPPSSSYSPSTSSSPYNFRPRLSSSYQAIPCSSPVCASQARDLPSPPSCNSTTRLCDVSVSYADGSSSDGTLALDTFLIGRSPPLRVAFGCMGSSYSSAPSGAATGLLGMNRGSLSLVSQMGTRRFSYCIAEGSSSGVLLLGNASLPFALALNYTPLIQISLPLPYFDRVAYSVQLEGIRVAGVLLPIPKSVLVPDHTGAGQTMVDSGTQFTFLLGPAYTALKNEFLRQTRGVLAVLDDPFFVFQGAFDLCFKVPTSRLELPPLPAVTLVLRGAEVTVAGGRLLYRVPGEQRGGDGIWCLTFGNSELVPMEAYVIGHHHQQNVWVEYDLERGRVGFAPVQCDVASRRLAAAL